MIPLLLLSLVPASRGIRITETGSRPTGLYQGQPVGNKQGLIITAKPEYDKFSEISFHSVECGPGKVCSQAISIIEETTGSYKDFERSTFPDDTFRITEDRFYAVRPAEQQDDRFYSVRPADDGSFADRNDHISLDRKSDRLGSAYWKADNYGDDLYDFDRTSLPNRRKYQEYIPTWRPEKSGFDSSSYGVSKQASDLWDDPPTINYGLDNDIGNRYPTRGDRYEDPPHAAWDRIDGAGGDRYEHPSHAAWDRIDGGGGDRYEHPPHVAGDRIDGAGEPANSVPGYSSLLSVSLGLQDPEANKRKEKPRASTPHSVSVASSLGIVQGPEYPRKPTHQPATLKNRRTTTAPPTTFELDTADSRVYQKEVAGQRSPPGRVKDGDLSHSNPWRKERYDPFAFQSLNQLSRNPAKSWTEVESLPVSSTHSRHSVQEPEYKLVKNSSRAPIVIDYKDATERNDIASGTFHTWRPPLVQLGQPGTRGGSSYKKSLYKTYATDTSKSIGKTKSQGSVGGYQGADRPIFVSLNQAENREILSLVPTLPPRDYFPPDPDQMGVRKPSDVGQRYNSSNKDEYWGQNRFPSASEMWEGYSQVMEELLREEAEMSKYNTINTNRDSNKYVGSPQIVSARPILVGPSQEEAAASTILSSYGDRYGWDDSPRDRAEDVSYAPVRNWTSLDVAKPKWEEEEQFSSYGRGEALPIDMQDLTGEEKKTFGTWDETLNIVPARTRSMEPRTRQWILLSKSLAEEGDTGADAEGNRVGRARVGINVQSKLLARKPI